MAPPTVLLTTQDTWLCLNGTPGMRGTTVRYRRMETAEVSTPWHLVWRPCCSIETREEVEQSALSETRQVDVRIYLLLAFVTHMVYRNTISQFTLAVNEEI